jgi:hypothetical protein
MFEWGLFEDAEVERGRLVKEANFEAEKKINIKRFSFPSLLLCVKAVFLLEMGQNQQSQLKNLIKSKGWHYCCLVDFIKFLSGDCWFWPISSEKTAITHSKVGKPIFFSASKLASFSLGVLKKPSLKHLIFSVFQLRKSWSTIGYYSNPVLFYFSKQNLSTSADSELKKDWNAVWYKL